MTLSIEKKTPSYNQLPENYLVALTNYSAISLNGEEQNKYLQGQVTCDVNTLTPSNVLTGAHCNAKGKVFSCFRLFSRNESHLLFQPKSTLDNSLSELKKFGVFSKVDINEVKNLAFFALVGKQAETLLKNAFGQSPCHLTPVIQFNTTTIVYLPGNDDRYLIIDELTNLEAILSQFSLPLYNPEIWTLLEIKEGFPCLSILETNEYVPQMLNMQSINGISFTKGCYLGQETVARMQYLGKNKKAMYALTGQIEGDISSVTIEKQLGENWRQAGDIVAIYQADDHQTYIQAVLANNIDSTTQLRIKDHPESSLELLDLPYSHNRE